MMFYYEKEYNRIMESKKPNSRKAMLLANLMSQMEQRYNIPMMKSPQWESQNHEVFNLYKKVSDSRKF